ncbi:PQQ-binding-like beta-propeller repeat protein [Actinoplanes sp. NPDC051513]|uniref:outer membrane protein assembly factor BamB family protein n=1 Tax=Actinoplanes sp. NPDC051513 TaxID=3363908 RepID=UPI0037BAC947
MKIKVYTVAAVLVLVPAPAAAASPSEWPQPGYGPGSTYYNPNESRLNAGTIDRIRERWKLPAHGPSRCETGADPVLAGGRLFTTDPGGIGAYDPATGARRWHLGLPRTTVRRLAIADGRLLMLSSECALPAEYESHLTAYDPATGRRLWAAGLAKFSYDMRIDRGTIALDSNQDGLASTIAYGVSDGRFRWLRRGDRGDGLVPAGGRVLLRGAGGGAMGVSIADGRTLWRTKNNWYAVGSDPAGTRFYVGGPGLSAVDAATGRVLWASPLQAAEVTSDGRHVYFARARSVECLDAATGHKLWSIHLHGVAGRPVRAGGLLYAANAANPDAASPTNPDAASPTNPDAASPANPDAVGAATLAIVDAATGRPEKSGISGSVDHPAVVAGGRLFTTDGDELRAYY